MSKDSEKIDEIFQIHENETKTGTRSQSFSKIHMKTGLLNSANVDFSLAERQNHIRNAVEFGYLCIRK